MPGWQLGDVLWQRRKGPPLGTFGTVADYIGLPSYFDWDFRGAYHVVNGTGPIQTGTLHFQCDYGNGFVDFAVMLNYQPNDGAPPPPLSYPPNWEQATLLLANITRDKPRTFITRAYAETSYTGDPYSDELTITTTPPGTPYPLLRTGDYAVIVKLLSPVRTITGIYEAPYIAGLRIAGRQPTLVVSTSHLGADGEVGEDIEIYGVGEFTVRQKKPDGRAFPGVDEGLTRLKLEEVS